MPVRVVTEGGSPVRIVTSGGDPVRIVTDGISDPVRVIGGGLAPDAPTFVSGEVGTIDASTVVVTFSTDISAPCGDCALGFTVLVNGAPDAITACVIVGGNTVQLTLTNPVVWGDTVTVSYDSAVGCIMESTGETDLATFAAQAVTNNLAMPWYRAGGAPMPIAVYQAKGAASYAASKVNLANPGTYNATDGAAFPTWAAATGWTFASASSQYLTTGLVPASNQTWSAIVRFSGTPGLNNRLFGAGCASFTRMFAITPQYAGSGVEYANGADVTVLPAASSGNLAVAGTQGYRNGVAEGAAIAAGSGTISVGINIGVYNNNGSNFQYLTGSIQAIAFYSSVLTAPMVSAIVAAMAAL